MSDIYLIIWLYDIHERMGYYMVCLLHSFIILMVSVITRCLIFISSFDCMISMNVWVITWCVCCIHLLYCWFLLSHDVWYLSHRLTIWYPWTYGLLHGVFVAFIYYSAGFCYQHDVWYLSHRLTIWYPWTYGLLHGVFVAFIYYIAGFCYHTMSDIYLIVWLYDIHERMGYYMVCLLHSFIIVLVSVITRCLIFISSFDYMISMNVWVITWCVSCIYLLYCWFLLSHDVWYLSHRLTIWYQWTYGLLHGVFVAFIYYIAGFLLSHDAWYLSHRLTVWYPWTYWLLHGVFVAFIYYSAGFCYHTMSDIYLIVWLYDIHERIGYYMVCLLHSFIILLVSVFTRRLIFISSCDYMISMNVWVIQ